MALDGAGVSGDRACKEETVGVYGADFGARFLAGIGQRDRD